VQCIVKLKMRIADVLFDSDDGRFDGTVEGKYN
jgi:hypothetical protein